MVCEIDILCLSVSNYVAFSISALLGHHQGASITSPTPTVVFLSSFHAFCFGFLSFSSDPDGRDFCLELLPGIPELPYSKWSRLTPHSCQLLAEQKGKHNSKESRRSLSVVHINTPLGSYSILLLLIDQSPDGGWRSL
jgi:hypothetical protein